MNTHFHWIDVIIIVGYLVALTSIGVYFSRRQSSLEDFFLAGRSMGWLPVGLSLMAALNSGIDYVMGPSATIQFGLILLLITTSWILIYPWVSLVTLPFYRRLNVYSAYAYLEARFDVRVRALAAGIFLLWRLGWLATAMYVPCLAVHAATEGRLPLLPMILVLGAIVTFYTMVGGIRAVIWTDVVQFFVMMGGLLGTVFVVINNVPGGVGEIWQIAQAQGKTEIFHVIPGMVEADWWGKIRLFFSEPITIPALLCAGLVGRITLYTSDQVMVQRFQTTHSVGDSRRAFVINALGDVLWTVGLAFVGLALLAYYQHRPTAAEIPSDRLFPTFIAQVFPVGLTGLVIAAIFAASLSSIDSALNSCTAVFMMDFYGRFWGGKSSPNASHAIAGDEQTQVRVSRLATLVLGIIGMVLASQVSRLGTILEIANKVIQSFTGPLFGIFLLGMFSRTANSRGALIGGLAGTLVSAYVAFFSSIGFLWPSTFGFAATVLAGFGSSFLTKGRETMSEPLTFRRVMAMPEEGAIPLAVFTEEPGRPVPL